MPATQSKKTLTVSRRSLQFDEYLKAADNSTALSKYDFKSSELVETAYNTLLCLAAGKVCGDMKSVSSGTTLKAIKLVLERIVPMQTTTATQIIDDGDIDLSEF